MLLPQRYPYGGRIPRKYNVTRDDLVKAAHAKVGCTQIAAKHSVDSMFDVLAGFLAQGRTIEIRGVVTLQVKHRKARPARNPNTGEPAWVMPGKAVKAKFPRGFLNEI